MSSTWPDLLDNLPVNHADGSEIIHDFFNNNPNAAVNAIERYLTATNSRFWSMAVDANSPSWTLPLIGPNSRPTDGIPNAPALTLLAQANALHLPLSIAQLKESPPTTLQSQINATPSGGVCVINPGYIYREAVTIANPITLVGRGLVSWRGTDDWSTGGVSGNTWSVSGSQWLSSLAIPATSPFNTTDPTEGSPTDTYSQNHREVLFSDGIGVHLVSSQTPTAGQWAIQTGTRKVLLGFNPSGHKLEVGVRAPLITLSGNNKFTVDAIDFRQVPTSGVGQPFVIDGGGVTTAQLTIQNCMIGWCHGGGMNFGAMTNLLVQNCVVHDCGTAGLGGPACTNPVYRKCILFNNGLPLYGWDSGFNSGGIKTNVCDGVLYDGCVAFANQGYGLWCDSQTIRAVIQNNVCWDNYISTGGSGNQISYEISSFGVIKYNVVFRTPNNPSGLGNTDVGIFLSNSRWVDVYGNLVMHCPINFELYYSQARTDDPPGNNLDITHMGGWTIHGNYVIGRYHANTIDAQPNTSDLAIQYQDDGGVGTYSTNVTSNTGGVLPGTSIADGNVYGYPALINNGANFLEVQQEPDSRWWYSASGGITQINTIAGWIAALSGRLGANSRYMLDAERVSYLRKFGLVP